MYVMKSQDEIKRILETEGTKYTIRELSRRHNIELKRFSRLFPELTRKMIEKRKSIMRNRYRVSTSKEVKKYMKAQERICLSCDKPFYSVSEINRMCNLCRNKEEYL